MHLLKQYTVSVNMAASLVTVLIFLFRDYIQVFLCLFFIRSQFEESGICGIKSALLINVFVFCFFWFYGFCFIFIYLFLQSLMVPTTASHKQRNCKSIRNLDISSDFCLQKRILFSDLICDSHNTGINSFFITYIDSHKHAHTHAYM